MHGCRSLVNAVWVFRYRSLRRADQSSRGVLLSVVCLNVMEVRHKGGLGALGLSSHEKKETGRLSL
jgi:hypothetical protein